jgi:ornithine carbamoyltransferase
MLGCGRLGIHMTVGCPRELSPDPRYAETARELAARSASTLSIVEDPQEAVRGADIVYTDVWVSMGREAEQDHRSLLLAPYQVNEELVRNAAEDYIFMHCLPAHIGDEVTAAVAYGPHSVIFDEAENRLHVQKALMVFLLECNKGSIDEARSD